MRLLRVDIGVIAAIQHNHEYPAWSEPMSVGYVGSSQWL